MSTKLSVNLNSGVLEVEGSEELVKEVYKDFKVLFGKTTSETAVSSEVSSAAPTPVAVSTETVKTEPAEEKVVRKVPKKLRANKSLMILSEVNTEPAGKASLKDFMAGFVPQEDEEFMLLILAYLKGILEFPTTGIDHMFTAIKSIGKRVPRNFARVLYEQANAKGWLDVVSQDDIRLTPAGEKYVLEGVRKKRAYNKKK